MSATSQGILSVLILLAGLPLATVPLEPAASILLVLGVLALESQSFMLGRHYRFSPAAPLLLAAGLSPNFGLLSALPAVLFLVLYQSPQALLEGFGHRLSVVLSLAVSGVLHDQGEGSPVVKSLMVAAIYLVARIFGETRFEPESPAERLVWRELHLRIRPMEVALAILVIPFADLLNANPWMGLLVLPVLAVLPLAAENIFLTSHNKSVAATLRSLRKARKREKVVAQKLSLAKQEKTILENFARHLSSEPTLMEVAQALIATVRSLVDSQNLIVFLSNPPEPFCYHVEEKLIPTIQAHPLLHLNEPAALQALADGRTVVREDEPSEGRLLFTTPVVTAIPLGQLGVLCIGTATSPPKSCLKQLEWICAKAALALSSAFQNQTKDLNRKTTEQKVERLAEKVEHLSALVAGAETMASSLNPVEVRRLFLKTVKEVLPQDAGMFQERDGSTLSWGHEIRLLPALLNDVTTKQQAIVVNDINRLKQMSEVPISSLVVAPLNTTNSDAPLAVIALAGKDLTYTRSLQDQLFILASQAAMAISNAKLYQEVLLAREELEKSQARLVQSSKMTAMGQLSAGVAHELNSPIGAISICLDEALEMFESHPDMVRRLLEKGQVAVERARVIVDRLLAYCRLDSVVTEEIDLMELLEDTTDFLSYQLKNIDVRLEGDRAKILGDYHALQQVFTNLLVNAAQSLKRQAPNQPWIKVRVESSETGAEVTVEDNGAGIPAHQLSRIFDPFFTTKEPGEGTGLGLWAGHQIVERHGGRILVESREGEGARFEVQLPVQPPQQALECI